MIYIDETALVEDGAQIGDGCRIWRNAHVRSGARIGENCTIGMGVYVDGGVVIGSNCKIQNYAVIYRPAVIDDGVFVGPFAIFTNDRIPRAITFDGKLKGNDDWEAVASHVMRGASIGAGAIVLPGVKIGAWSMIAAGAIVAHDVDEHCLVLGCASPVTGMAPDIRRRLL